MSNPHDPSAEEPTPAAPTETEPEVDVYVPTGADYVSNREFADFPISPEVLKAIHEIGYRTATPVQAVTIEPALAGRDLLVRAKTGTGKTAAFCIPIVERIADGERVPRAIVLAPTRELAQQTADEFTALTKYRDLKVALLVGGVPMGSQERALEEGASIIVGTPGRVLDHMRRRNLDLSQSLVGCLDEADEMLSMGFYEDVTSILDALPKEAQILLFSATVSADAQRIIARYLKDPESIMLSTDADQVEGIEHHIYETPTGQHKIRSLLYLIDLEDPGSAIIFCNTRDDAATVASFLDRQGLDAQLLSGELPQARRNRVMKQVKAGEVRFLVATDVASRGIDISDLTHVINYALPQDPAVYLHRTGRTGRIGKKGLALSLVSGSDFTTKKVLETQHKVKFIEKKFPTPEEAINRRVERQAAQIHGAMGNLVFEAYLPTARALMDRPDGDVLVAAALRAFFQWDRKRRAEMSGTDDEEPLDALEPRRDRLDRSERPARSDRPEREERRSTRGEGRGEERRPKRGERDRDRKKDRPERDKDRPRERRGASTRAPADELSLDLDALLLEGDVVAAPASEAAPADAGFDEAEGDEKKKKKRRRRKKKTEGGEEGAEAGLDALLVEDGDAPAPAKKQSEGEMDDLDALLSFD